MRLAHVHPAFGAASGSAPNAPGGRGGAYGAAPALATVLLLALAAASAAPAQGVLDEYDRDDIDPYAGLAVHPGYRTSIQPATGDPRSGVGRGGGQPGFSQVGQATQNTPWSGVWWPRKPVELAFMAFSQGLSPLEKYDTLVYSYYGRNPGAAAWEADPAHGHNEAPTRGVDWSGHCNGLAAAAILEAEPRQTVRVPLGNNPAYLKLSLQSPYYAPSGLFRDGQDDYSYYRAAGGAIDLTVADQKGWLCEMYMNVYTQQFENRDLLGHRYSSPYPDMWDPTYRDIHPHYFHYLLQAFVKNRGQAIVVEVDPGFPVNNHPLYRYESSSVFYPQRSRYSVTTTVYYADYARGYHDVGTTPMRQTYTYDLIVDREGRIIRGEWTGSSQYNHPDFVWIPTQLAPPGNAYSNPGLNHRFASYLMGRGR
jgi:hypothetical protein